MARRKSGNPFDGEEEAELDISPLIDVAFLLLIYFIVTTTLIKQEADLGLRLPGITEGDMTKSEVDQMLIKIAADGSISVNDEITDSDPNDRRVPKLTERLKLYQEIADAAGSEALVVIGCDNQAPNQRFLDVLNACKAADLKNVSLAQPESE